MMQHLHEALSYILAISVLVTAHEFGHFWVARRCGVRVMKFSIGFGRTLFSRTDKHGTEFIVAAIPLGGYIKMADEREEPVPEEWLSQAFNRKQVWQRIAIVAAGPVANFLLAFVIFWFLNLGAQTGIVARIGTLDTNSIAVTAGLESGEDIVAVDGHETPMLQDVLDRLMSHLGESGEIRITTRYPDRSERYDTVIDIHDWMKNEVQPDPLLGLGIHLYFPAIPPVIETVQPDGPASKAALLPGDEIVDIDGQRMPERTDAVTYIHAHPGAVLDFAIRRGDATLHLKMVPDRKEIDGKVVGLIGIAMKSPVWPEDMKREFSYGVAGAGVKAGQEVVQMSVFLVKAVKKLLTGQLSVRNVNGPIATAKLADDAIHSGFESFVRLLAFLSLSLGVMNLLPIPVLDGGHVVYFVVEAITGKPVPMRVLEFGFQIGLFIIISLMLLAFYNDFTMHF